MDEYVCKRSLSFGYNFCKLKQNLGVVNITSHFAFFRTLPNKLVVYTRSKSQQGQTGQGNV